MIRGFDFDCRIGYHTDPSYFFLSISGQFLVLILFDLTKTELVFQRFMSSGRTAAFGLHRTRRRRRFRQYKTYGIEVNSLYDFSFSALRTIGFPSVTPSPPSPCPVSVCILIVIYFIIRIKGTNLTVFVLTIYSIRER